MNPRGAGDEPRRRFCFVGWLALSRQAALLGAGSSDLPFLAMLETSGANRVVATPASKQMQISVIVPVRNEAKSIHLLLDGLLGQTRPPDEIVITDGGSSDATATIIEEYCTRCSSLRLVRESNALPGRGRNIAAANAAYEWLAFIDAGVIPTNKWLAELAECAQRDERIDVVFGGWQPITDTFFKECAAIAYAQVPDKEVREQFKKARAISSSLMRRVVWQQVGGFAEDLRSAEDLLFINRVEESGFKIGYAPEAQVKWIMEPTFWRTFKRFVAYSRSNLRAGLAKQWHVVVLSRYLALLLFAVALRGLTTWWAIVSVALLLLMFVARASVSLVRNRRTFPANPARNIRRLLVIVLLLITIDAATLAGTVNWALRDKLRLF